MILALAFLAGCGKDDVPASRGVALGVEVTRVRPAGQAEALAYSGTIEESESVPLSFGLPGTVSRLLVHEGQTVRSGQLLATLDGESSRHAYEMSRATEKRAQDAYDRLLPMRENGTIPDIKFIEVQTGLEQARSAAAIAKKNMEDCSLRATRSGVIGRCTMNPGMVVIPGVSSITIVDIRTVFAVVSVAEGEIADIRQGAAARVAIGALGGRVCEGTVREIGVIADPIAHTYTVKTAVANPARDIRPGMVCTVQLAGREAAACLTVPARCVGADGAGTPRVYVVDTARNRVEWREVETGRLLRDRVEILHGLREGECVVTAGQHRLYPDAPVWIRNW
jgi:RND family efflux transporter MFP subunit